MRSFCIFVFNFELLKDCNFQYVLIENEYKPSTIPDFSPFLLQHVVSKRVHNIFSGLCFNQLLGKSKHPDFRI